MMSLSIFRVCFWFIATYSVLDNGTITLKVDRSTIWITAAIIKWTIWVKKFIACVRKINGTLSGNTDKQTFNDETLVFGGITLNSFSRNRFWNRVCIIKLLPNIIFRLSTIKLCSFVGKFIQKVTKIQKPIYQIGEI